MLVTGYRSRLVSTGEAARLLGVNSRTVLNWIKGDKIPYVQLPGGDYRIPLGALVQCLPGTYDLGAELQALDVAAANVDMDEDEAAQVAARG
jgi:excisionase family DNA binding protein